MERQNESIGNSPKEKKQIILNMNKMRMKIEDIAKATELSQEEVERIIKEETKK